MLVEHSFVTTTEADSAIDQAAQLLQMMGFKISSRSPQSLEVRRGRANPNTPKIRLLPQQVRLVFDRGRIDVAASMTCRGGKTLPVHISFMTALVRALEDLLVARMPMQEAAADWMRLEALNPRHRTGMDYLGLVLLSILLGLLALTVVIVIMAACWR